MSLVKGSLRDLRSHFHSQAAQGHTRTKNIRLADLPWEELPSPTRKFHSFCRNVSVALVSSRNTGLLGGGHPFDVQIRRIPPETV